MTPTHAGLTGPAAALLVACAATLVLALKEILFRRSLRSARRPKPPGPT